LQKEVIVMNNLKRAMSILLIPLTAVFSISAVADGMKTKPGLWETTMTTTFPMMPQPMVQTIKECMTEEEMDPDKVMKDTGECTYTKVETSDTTMSMEMTCDKDGTVMTGKGAFESAGDRMSGKIDMEMDAQGQKMTMQIAWEGRRIGPCS
jgi:hypothetical protein